MKVHTWSINMYIADSWARKIQWVCVQKLDNDAKRFPGVFSRETSKLCPWGYGGPCVAPQTFFSEV